MLRESRFGRVVRAPHPLASCSVPALGTRLAGDWPPSAVCPGQPWNLENLLRPGEPPEAAAYQAKLTALAAVITNLAPDVLAVQEVDDPEALTGPRGPGRGQLVHRAGPSGPGVASGWVTCPASS